MGNKIESLQHRISLAIKASGFSQAHIAKELGISRQGLNAIVCGRAPGRKHLEALAGLIGVSPVWILNGGEVPRNLQAALDEGSLPSPGQYDEIEQVFITLLQDALKILRGLESDNHNEYCRRMKPFSSAMRRFVESTDEPPGPFGIQIEDHLNLIRAAGIHLTSELVNNCSVGHSSLSRKRIGIKKSPYSYPIDPPTYLPYENFMVVRESLLRDIRLSKEYQKDLRPLLKTLDLIWQRQRKGAIRAEWNSLLEYYESDFEMIEKFFRDMARKSRLDNR